MRVERLVVLDRDGVINEDSDDYIKSSSEWIPIAGSIEAISLLSQAGFRVAVVSNQSGIARRLFDVAALNRIHGRLMELVEKSGGHLEMISYCPHSPSEGCECRKPGVGLIADLADRFGFAVTGAPFVGDSITDLEAARRIGMKPILVRTGKGRLTLRDWPDQISSICVFDDLKQAAQDIVTRWGIP